MIKHITATTNVAIATYMPTVKARRCLGDNIRGAATAAAVAMVPFIFIFFRFLLGRRIQRRYRVFVFSFATNYKKSLNNDRGSKFDVQKWDSEERKNVT